ncbi:lamin tail domain-containing protein [Amycolatopsis sp. EV170708-02-1]|uniref:lamin tail domain-containing protein n=1 Tax=Amycolatopsis sp. EV170708-02-1 TaxID=2919322 RepID=UPI001F0BC80D|nr:lamin tail domain-containing protein [Amycolatopsis sp. EV170708-02-1]UMP06813.1 lamin tail domain-containing protein [Amycolatopsis sp. EV170708-02-1]
MKRTISVIAAAIAAMFSIGAANVAVADVAVADEQAAAVPRSVFISELSTQGVGPDATFKEFLELSNRANYTVTIGGARLLANFSNFEFEIAQIPTGTRLAPGQTYLLASQRLAGSVQPDQIFTTTMDIPNSVGISLQTVMGRQLDVVGTTYRTAYRSGIPASPLTQQDAVQRKSLHRVLFTGSNQVDFQKLPASPGRPG